MIVRLYDNHYEVRNFLGISMRVMVIEDMFAHKLCALLDRREIASRDIFDCWFFLSKGTSVNKTIVETRMGEPLKEYLGRCAATVRRVSVKSLAQGLGELIGADMKLFVKSGLKTELISLLKTFAEFPIIKDR